MKLRKIDVSAMPATQDGGRMTRIWYDTKTYDGENLPLRKDALVYLPVGYDREAERRYPVLYLMHGGGGDSNEIFGGEEARTPLKKMLDHAIAARVIPPMIVVAPSFQVEGHNEARRQIAAAAELTHRFPKEMKNDLIPAVTEQLRTVDDRRARAFGGFSMGAETTWSVLTECLEQVWCYLPMSGDYWAIALKGGKDYPVETVDALLEKVKAQGVSPRDYRILAMTGDLDIAYEALDPMACEMARRAPWFTLGETPEEGNFCYGLMPGAAHTYDACYEYVWQAAPYLFDVEEWKQ